MEIWRRKLLDKLNAKMEGVPLQGTPPRGKEGKRVLQVGNVNGVKKKVKVEY
jgi:hypothetical protein